ncbi:MAG: RIP metalloprotease RseP [Flavobacteriales bacterium]
MDFFTILIKAAQLFLSLAILVTLHEFGHFIPAKIFKTRIERFYLFFNPLFSVFRRKKVNGVTKTAWFTKESPKEWKEDPDSTEWGFGWLPLGGYVKIAGMIDESMDTEQLKQPAQSWEFRSKKPWQRLIIMVGGVFVNLILGFAIYIGVVYTWGQVELKPVHLEHGLSVHPYLEKHHLSSGDKVLTIEGKEVLNLDELNKGIMFRGARNLTVLHPDGKTEKITLPDDIDRTLFQEGALPAFGLRSTAHSVGEVVNNSPAKKAKLKKDDLILAVNADTIHYFDELSKALYESKGKKATLTVLRGQDTLELKAKVKKDGTIGFQTSGKVLIDSAAIRTRHYDLSKSISIGMTYGKHTLTDYISQFKFVFTKKGATSIGGFAAIGNMFPPVWDWESFWLSTALLSIILAFMNILPIPALDGGHVVFLLYEIITGKEAPQKVLEYAQMVGIVLLLTLMIYANGNDLIRWISSF